MRLSEVFAEADGFSMRTHAPDVAWLMARQVLVSDFAEFMREYIYVVVASGFRGAVAATLTDRLHACLDFEAGVIKESMESIFKNKAKTLAITKTFYSLKDNYEDASKEWRVPADLQALPFIGPTTCWHLARNIGLQSSVKPDLHMKRLFNRLFKRSDASFIQERIVELAKALGQPPGVVDFKLWVYLSHEGKVKDCCNGGQRLR
ncbi:hypothetical protein GMRT_15335 [Giardia muris]|uniref:Uncharacterized protein n=1 Tax=Giardia muris TaxID=5742 RepID=A0A4Z1SSL9_GIAMU|nr:hypothetical protein GMRT_15335 [Giardia muris]|eukprot:TNJ28916.1 hypothetical protein GMRT_15335 [Giardia muris]